MDMWLEGMQIVAFTCCVFRAKANNKAMYSLFSSLCENGLSLWALDSQVFASVGTAILFPSILGFSLYNQFSVSPERKA